MAKDDQGKWELVNVDVHCCLPSPIRVVDGRNVYTPAEGINPYTLFDKKSDALVKVP
jgi:hypothetical protein